MKLRITMLAAALSLALSAVATASDKGNKKQSPTQPTQQQVKQAERATPPADDDDYIHGQNVREAAPRDAAGQPVRETAQTQGDFMQLDADKSGVLSRAELATNADLSTHFALLDTDNNGEVSRIEFNQSVTLDIDDSDDD